MRTGHSWHSWPQLTKVIFHAIWRHAQHIKLGGRRRKGGRFGVMVFVFPSNRYMWWSSTFLDMAEHLPFKWWMNSLFCFAFTHGFCFTIKLSLSSHFYASDSLPHPTRVGSEQMAVWGLVADWGCVSSAAACVAREILVERELWLEGSKEVPLSWRAGKEQNETCAGVFKP